MDITTKNGRTSRKEQGRGVSGFTLIELLVVIVVMAIMAAILLPALSRGKEQAKSTACRSNMKQLALAFLMYSEDNGDTLPWAGGIGRAITSPENYGADWCATPPEMAGLSMTPASADLPGFGHNAECGSIYPYVTSQPRKEFDPDFKEPTQVYRCPGIGKLGDALRVNYSANGWIDPGRPFGGTAGTVAARGLLTTAVADPSRKVLLLNENPDYMTSPAFLPGPKKPGLSMRDSYFHLDRANLAFIDGHIESVSSKTFSSMRGRDVGLYFDAGK